MADYANLIARIRSEVGDFGSPFVDTFLGADELSSYDLSEVNVSQCVATVVQGATAVTLKPGVDYVLDTHEGRIVLANPVYSPLHQGQTLRVTGMSAGMFTDTDLTQYIDDAFAQHVYGRTVQTRYQDQYGFIRYTDAPLTLANLPAIETPLLAYLTTINVLWTLASDASTDVDISTAEGTNVPRSQRYHQLMAHIEALQARYDHLAQQLNVGLSRVEVITMLRVSRTTNRRVPVFKEREYDDASMPKRLLPPIDGAEIEDQSGIPSPLMPGVWG